MRTHIVLTCVMVLVGVQGCVEVQEFRGPNGRPAYSMHCGDDLNACYKKAGDACSAGYNILDRSTGTVAVPAGGSIIAVPAYTLAIECK